MTMEAALIMRGLGSWLSTPDIVFWPGGPGSGKKARTLPQAVVHGTVIARALAIPLCGTRLGEPIEMIGGVPVAGLDEIIIDLLRYAHPLQAWVGVTSALRSMAEYHRSTRDDLRVEDAQNRARLAAKLDSLAGSGGVERGRKILESVNTRAESLPEAVVLWVLHTIVMVPVGEGPPFEAQAGVQTSTELFHVDVGFPRARFGIEFDGLSKFIEHPDRMEWHLNRQHEILAAGWDVIPLGWADVRNPEALANKLMEKLLAKGIPTQAPGGPLWAEMPPEILNLLRIT